MTPIKLVDETGEILGGIIMSDHAMITLIREKAVILYPPSPPPTVFPLKELQSPIDTRRVMIVPAYGPFDAVMIAQGTLYDFERCGGCFFIPGYAMLMKGRR